MSNVSDNNDRRGNTVVIPISREERARETSLRKHFARFWATTTGEPRAVYDIFVSGSPMAEGTSFEPVRENGVHGWWVRPGHAEPGRAILFIHGGGYGLGSATAYRGFVSQIVRRTQIPALVIDYPLAPEATLPAAPTAAVRAWNWMVSQGFGQIALVGDSAGGGLALVTLAEITKLRQGAAPIAGVVFSPWTDLAFTGASMTDATIEDPLIAYDYLRASAGQYLGVVQAEDPLASPLFGNLLGLPKLLIQVGTDERLLDDARQYADRARAAGVPVQLEIWEGMHHVFQLDVAHLESSRTALDHAARFLTDAFTSEPA
jgi:epsilon-lactone hydrolase